MFPRVAFQLPSGRILYGPAALLEYFRMMRVNPATWPAGVFTVMSTPAHDWRGYDLYYSWHPWHATPYAHNAYTRAGTVEDVDAEWRQAFALQNRFTIAETPERLWDTTGFINCFVRPMTHNCYRLTYIMANYQTGCDFYTRFSIELSMVTKHH